MKKEQSFEVMLEELEKIVNEMESGGLSLEETLALYEKGAEIEKKLHQKLESNKQRLTVLLKNESQFNEVPLEEEE